MSPWLQFMFKFANISKLAIASLVEAARSDMSLKTVPKETVLAKPVSKDTQSNAGFSHKAGSANLGTIAPTSTPPLPALATSTCKFRPWMEESKTCAKLSRCLKMKYFELKNVNNCERCDYKASSSISLKAHMSKKHKDLLQPPRQEEQRASSPDATLNLSVPGDERIEISTSPCSMLSEESPTMCEWCYCQFKTSSKSDMMKHVTSAHTITTDFVFPESKVKIVCPEGEEFCGKEFFLDQIFALHVYSEHKVGFNCDHCHAFLPGGDEMQEIHMKLCTFPCSGDSKCYCKLFIS